MGETSAFAPLLMSGGCSTDYFTISQRRINLCPVETGAHSKPPPTDLLLADIWRYRLGAAAVACASVLPYGSDACAAAHGLSRAELPHGVCGIGPSGYTIAGPVSFCSVFL